MLYCYDSRLTFHYSKLEMRLCQKNNKGIIYNSNLSKFTDFEGKEVDINGKLIFPRTGVIQIYEMNNEIIKQGGMPIITNEQIDNIVDWPKFYFPERKVYILKGKDLINEDIIKKLERNFKKNIFIKTKEKNYNGVIPITLLRDSECVFYKALMYHLEEDFIVSPNITVIEDEFGKKEYRCFVINNEVINISRMTDHIMHQIEGEVFEKAKEIVENVKGKLPNSYVVDLLEYEYNGKTNIDVVEFNPIHSSGLYLYNSVIEKSKDMLHSDIRNLPGEFIEQTDKYTTTGTMINERTPLYQISNSFAGDIRSICLTGDRGLSFSTCTDISVEDLARHDAKYNFTVLTPLEDEEENIDYCDNNEHEDEILKLVLEEAQKRLFKEIK